MHSVYDGTYVTKFDDTDTVENISWQVSLLFWEVLNINLGREVKIEYLFVTAIYFIWKYWT